MAEEVKVKVKLDTREAEAQARRLSQRSRQARQRVAQRPARSRLPSISSPSLTGTTLGASVGGRAIGARAAAAAGPVGVGLAAIATAVAVVPDAARSAASIGKAFSGEIASVLKTFGLSSGTIPQIQASIERSLDETADMFDVVERLKEKVGLGRLNALPLIGSLVLSGEDLSLQDARVLGDAFARKEKRDKILVEFEKQRQTKISINAQKWGLGKVYDEARKFLGSD